LSLSIHRNFSSNVYTNPFTNFISFPSIVSIQKYTHSCTQKRCWCTNCHLATIAEGTRRTDQVVKLITIMSNQTTSSQYRCRRPPAEHWTCTRRFLLGEQVTSSSRNVLIKQLVLIAIKW